MTNFSKYHFGGDFHITVSIFNEASLNNIEKQQ